MRVVGIYEHLKQLRNSQQWSRRRRSQRIELSVPVVLHRRPTEGPQFSERTETLVVSAHGALMALVEKSSTWTKALLAKHKQGRTERVPRGLREERVGGTD